MGKNIVIVIPIAVILARRASTDFIMFDTQSCEVKNPFEIKLIEFGILIKYFFIYILQIGCVTSYLNATGIRNERISRCVIPIFVAVDPTTLKLNEEFQSRQPTYL